MRSNTVRSAPSQFALVTAPPWKDLSSDQRTQRRWILLTFAFLAVVSFASVALAQTTGPQIPHNNGSLPVIQVDVDLVLVNVTVLDPNDRLVSGLGKENFQVFEDEVEQEVVTFSNEDLPISIGLIVDMSGSMADKVERVNKAVTEFLKVANPRDEVFLVSFGDRAKLIRGFTSDVEELHNQMMYLRPRGQTALLDAIDLGLGEMKGADKAKRALVVISDGGDNHSRHHEASVRGLLKEADCQLYAVGVFDVNDMDRSKEERYGPTLLSELAEMTGGRLFRLSNASDLPDTAAKIGMELHNQYVLGYKPSDTRHDGTRRSIKVKLLPPKGLPPLKIHAKSGYNAPRQ